MREYQIQKYQQCKGQEKLQLFAMEPKPCKDGAEIGTPTCESEAGIS